MYLMYNKCTTEAMYIKEKQYTIKAMTRTHFIRSIDHSLDEYKFWLLNVYRYLSTKTYV